MLISQDGKPYSQDELDRTNSSIEKMQKKIAGYQTLAQEIQQGKVTKEELKQKVLDVGK